MHPLSIISTALTPVLAGASLAWAEGGQFSWQSAGLALLATLLARVGYEGVRQTITRHPPGKVLGEEAVVFLLFGPAAVLGSYYLQNNNLSFNSLIAASAIGLQSAAIQTADNYRRLKQGLATSRFSIVASLGPRRTQTLYSSLLLLPFLALLPLLFFRPVAGIALVTLSPSIRMIRFFCEVQSGQGLNRILTGTATIQLIFGLALSIALIFG